jgi:hypothetical protein
MLSVYQRKWQKKNVDNKKNKKYISVNKCLLGPRKIHRTFSPPDLYFPLIVFILCQYCMVRIAPSVRVVPHPNVLELSISGSGWVFEEVMRSFLSCWVQLGWEYMSLRAMVDHALADLWYSSINFVKYSLTLYLLGSFVCYLQPPHPSN